MRTTAYVCAILVVVSVGMPGHAQTNSWISPTRGYWDDYGKWSLGVAPTNAHTVCMTNDVSKTVTIDDFTSGSYPETMSVSNLVLSAPTGATNTLEMVFAGTDTPLRILDTFSLSSGGLLHLTGSALSLRSLTNSITNCFFSVDGTVVIENNSVLVADSGMYVGVDTNAKGVVLLNGGQLLLTNTLPSAIGVNGTGQMIVSNGQVQTSSGFIFVGSGDGSQGALTVAGGDWISGPYARLVIGMETGAVGVVSVSNRNFVMTNSFITLVGEDGSGQLSLAGGTNILGPIEVGGDTGSQGTLTMTGGKNTLQHALFIGAGPGATGTMWMAGGQFVQTNSYLASGKTNWWPTYVGDSGFGQLNVSNVNWLGGAMIVGVRSNAQGTVNLNGGSVTLLTNLVIASRSNSLGAVNLKGSSLTVTNGGIYIGNSGTGQVTALSGAISARDILLGNVSGSRGDLLLANSNSFVIASGSVSVGEGGFGKLRALGGSVHAMDIALGNGSNSYGEIVLDTNSIVVADAGIYIGGGANAIGYFSLNHGGMFVTNSLSGIGIGMSGFGQAIISNSEVRGSGSTIVGSSTGSEGSLSVVGGNYILAPNARLLIGMETGAAGAMSLTDANLVMTNSFITLIGGGGSGYLTLPNGTNTLGPVEVGGNPGSRGTLTMAGGFNTLQNALSVGTSLQATGTVWMTGGQLIATNLTTCIAPWGYGVLALSNGNWLGNSMSVGLYSNALGTVNLSGGTMMLFSKLVIGNCPSGGVGVVNVSGGSLYVTNTAHSAFIDLRKGQLNLNGGLLQTDILIKTNACGLLVRNGGTLIIGSLVLDPHLDEDGDGIPNGWEQAHGLDPLDAADASEDNDGDGFTNLQEYLAGTDPSNSASALRITSILPEGNDLRITWSVSTSKTYNVQVTTNLFDGSFTNLATVIVPASPVISETNYLNVGAVTNGELLFYRIKLVTP